MGRIFESVCLSLPLHKGDPAVEHVTVTLTKDILAELEPHVFQEVWSTKMDIFFNAVSVNPGGLQILSGLFQQPTTMYSLTAIVLRYLIDNLETLLEKPAQTVAVVIRMLRMTFSSVASFPDGNERILFPHLTTLLVDIFPMAARSQDPRNFLSVPYYLFRSLGQKTQQVSRFELLHKEVYLLLPELLDGVNRALELADDAVQREQLVEIALTTPARLQHLAPYITQLWRPLVLALRSQSGELLRQGLRTLELAVDNLPGVDLLDPSAEPVARDLVLALHKVVRPGTTSLENTQAATRILGKLGGQNRRILGFSPELQWEPSTFPVTVPVEFSSHVAQLQIKPACDVAISILSDPKTTIYHQEAFELLRTQTLYLLQTVSIHFDFGNSSRSD
jgi:transformation/transcription domain-associated protein